MTTLPEWPPCCPGLVTRESWHSLAQSPHQAQLRRFLLAAKSPAAVLAMAEELAIGRVCAVPEDRRVLPHLPRATGDLHTQAVLTGSGGERRQGQDPAPHGSGDNQQQSPLLCSDTTRLSAEVNK